MCGIAGIIGQYRPQAAIEKMLDQISHRGPDHRAASFPSDRVALGHVRLSIIDLSDAGRQPMVSRSGNEIIFNGELYNYLELREELRGFYDFRTNTDTEVILASYDKWGRACVEKFLGMFSIAIWDRSSREIVLVRDRLGIKPLYLCRLSNSSMAFASEIKGLTFGLGVPSDVNMLRLYDFLSVRMIDHTNETMFKGIEQLEPGTLVIFSENGKRIKDIKYWVPPIVKEEDKEPLTPRLVLELYELLEDVVRIHLRSDVRMGALISGGLDSTAIACFAAPYFNNPEDFHLFSAILKESNEENALIPFVQQHTGGTPHEYMHDGQGFVRDLPLLIYHQDEPFADASMYAHFDLCRSAHDHGVKVLMSGNGGDEIFGGYHLYLYGALGHLLRNNKLRAFYKSIRNIHDYHNYSYPRLIERAVSHAIPQGFRDYLRYKNLDANMDFFIDGREYASRFKFFQKYPGYGWFDQFLINGLRRYSLPGFLHYEDRNGMAFGIEMRVPMVDHRLVEFSFKIQPDALVGKGRTKEILRRVMDGRAPEQVVRQRGKYGFAAPLHLFMEQTRMFFMNQALEWVDEVPFLHTFKIRNKLLEYFEGNRQIDLPLIWRAICSAMWYHIFFSRKLSPTPLS